mgnify:CR=1 FL=1
MILLSMILPKKHPFFSVSSVILCAFAAGHLRFAPVAVHFSFYQLSSDKTKPNANKVTKNS